MLSTFLLACHAVAPPPVPPAAAPVPVASVPPAALPPAAPACTNNCPDYASTWSLTCPAGQRCIKVENLCADSLALAYQIGCNADGNPGAPECNCTSGPLVASGDSIYWPIVDGDFTSCSPWTPACLTAGLAILGNLTMPSCVHGTRVEFSAGNKADPYARFDSYNLDVEKDFYSVPVSFMPDLGCAIDHANHDCRQLWCGSATCPDAYATPTSGGCSDSRSPQAGCQDTFGADKGYTVTFCPVGCGSAACPSCLEANACP